MMPQRPLVFIRKILALYRQFTRFLHFIYILYNIKQSKFIRVLYDIFLKTQSIQWLARSIQTTKTKHISYNDFKSSKTSLKAVAVIFKFFKFLFSVLGASVPILMIRQPDWTKYDNFLSIDGNKVRYMDACQCSYTKGKRVR